MNVIMIRHGEPNYSIDSLTEKGWREAHYLADRLCKMKIDEVYCSPLGRAKDTAKEYLERTGRTAPILDWLCEFRGKIDIEGVGEDRLPWDMKPRIWRDREVLHRKEEWVEDEMMQTGTMLKHYRQVVAGLDQFLADHGYVREGNIYKAVRPNTDTVAFFCHFGITSVLMSIMLGLSPIDVLHDFSSYPTSLTTLSTEEREEGIAIFRCNGFSDVGHLYAAGEVPSLMGRGPEIYEGE